MEVDAVVADRGQLPVALVGVGADRRKIFLLRLDHLDPVVADPPVGGHGPQGCGELVRPGAGVVIVAAVGADAVGVAGAVLGLALGRIPAPHDEGEGQEDDGQQGAGHGVTSSCPVPRSTRERDCWKGAARGVKVLLSSSIWPYFLSFVNSNALERPQFQSVLTDYVLKLWIGFSFGYIPCFDFSLFLSLSMGGSLTALTVEI